MRESRGSSVSRDIRTIRTSLLSIARAVQRLAPLLQEAAIAPGKAPRRGRRLRLSPERRAALKLQGQYMGYLRGLKAGQKARVKALRAAKGVRPAIAFARRLAER